MDNTSIYKVNFSTDKIYFPTYNTNFDVLFYRTYQNF